MTNKPLLMQKIEESGYRLRWLAEKMGIGYQSFINKINGLTEFKAPEIRDLSELLKLTPEEITAIFFVPDDDKLETSEGK